MSDFVQRAHRIADEVLFPAAAQVDASGVIPPGHLKLLAAEGFYGLAAPPEHGGPELGFPELVEIIETLAGACLTTAFTWMQHNGVVRGLAETARADLRERYLAPAMRGELRCGVAFAGAIPRPPKLWAEPSEDGYLLRGEAPFVSGWGIIGLLQLSARHGDTIVNGLIEPVSGPGLEVEPLRLVAANGSNTVRLHFDDYRLPAERVSGTSSHADFLRNQSFGSRINGCVAMGVAGRCIRLLEEAGQAETARLLRKERTEVRGRLDAGLADPDTLPSARAAGSELALRAAAALVTATGSAAVIAGHHAERLLREASFTLVAASRPELRASLLELFGRAG